ncbi:hypothetical protein CFC21_083323 [Triticum aestivum]|uniref:Uncharacterized protein n=4 Tax=Triticum TaxID=4564 RepID=A0A9R1AZD7_TRITD|nr:hypothetical protein TRIUR3_13386 [Triticum urartu]KAF7079004.1 hypothetical protein CFC21_083323 [Triticum aestivum]VAI45775.1 unnamed protein product [Triticum turgidum subsp. durum]
MDEMLLRRYKIFQQRHPYRPHYKDMRTLGAEQWKAQFQVQLFKNSSLKEQQFTSLALTRMPAIVTFWGKLADSLDADKLQRWSAQEPIIVLFVGMPVHEFNETWPSSPVCHIAMERQYNIQNFDEAHLLQNFTIRCMFYNLYALAGNGNLIELDQFPIKTICNFGVVTLESVLSSNGRLSLMPNQ